MSPSDLKRHVRQTCEELREGANHTIYINPETGATAPIPRGSKEIGAALVAKICKELGIEKPAGR